MFFEILSTILWYCFRLALYSQLNINFVNNVIIVLIVNIVNIATIINIAKFVNIVNGVNIVNSVNNAVIIVVKIVVKIAANIVIIVKIASPRASIVSIFEFFFHGWGYINHKSKYFLNILCINR